MRLKTCSDFQVLEVQCMNEGSSGLWKSGLVGAEDFVGAPGSRLRSGKGLSRPSLDQESGWNRYSVQGGAVVWT